MPSLKPGEILGAGALSALATVGAFGGVVGSRAASNFPSAARSGSSRGARGNRSVSMAWS